MEFDWAPRAGPCDPARRRLVAFTTWPAWSTITRCGSPTSSAPRSICPTRRGRSSSREGARLRGCRITPICPFVAEPGSKNKLSKRKLDKYLKNPDFAKLNEHGRDRRRDRVGDHAEATFNPVIVDFYERVGFLPDGDCQLPAAAGLGAGRQDRVLHAPGDDRAVLAANA